MLMPSLTKRGNYHPVELLRYIDECKRMQVSPGTMAYDLGVPLHRVLYAIGDGYPYFRRQARLYDLAERQARP